MPIQFKAMSNHRSNFASTSFFDVISGDTRQSRKRLSGTNALPVTEQPQSELQTSSKLNVLAPFVSTDTVSHANNPKKNIMKERRMLSYSLFTSANERWRRAGHSRDIDETSGRCACPSSLGVPGSSPKLPTSRGTLQAGSRGWHPESYTSPIMHSCIQQFYTGLH